MPLRTAALAVTFVGPAVVATSSLAVVMGQARGYSYAASKGGLVAMIKAMAVELARYGIRANALLPGWTESGLTEQAFQWQNHCRAADVSARSAYPEVRTVRALHVHAELGGDDHPVPPAAERLAE